MKLKSLTNSAPDSFSVLLNYQSMYRLLFVIGIIATPAWCLETASQNKGALRARLLLLNSHLTSVSGLSARLQAPAYLRDQAPDNLCRA